MIFLNTAIGLLGLIGWSWVWYRGKYKTGSTIRTQSGVIALGSMWLMLVLADTAQHLQPTSLTITARVTILIGLWCLMPLLKNVYKSINENKGDDEMNDPTFFNWLRDQQDNKRLTQKMVDGAQALLAEMTHEEVKHALTLLNEWADDPIPSIAMMVSKAGSDKIAVFEGFESDPYQDIAGYWTIGYGNTYYEDGTPVRSTDKGLTKEQALDLKCAITNKKFAPAVNLILAEEIAAKKITQNMFDALVSLSYNIGESALKTSSVVKHIKAGNKQKAADSFLAWNKITKNGRKVVSNGLVNRRAIERELFLS